ncbi:MAG: hypothetical protein HRT45_17490 [Bdellovibrionales bacterium]|nr:hypothetical protein [Bdellovibrionales bacterium]
MGSLFRFLKYSFMVGGGISALMIFNAADTPFDLKYFTGDLAVKEQKQSQLEELKTPMSKPIVDKLAEQRRLTQEYIRKSQEKRAKQGLVKYREVDYVRIDNKYYPYNPKNIYNIDGVKTFFIPGGYDRFRTERAKARIKSLETKYNLSNNQLVDNAQQLLDNPLEGYSPKGIRKMQETLYQIKQQAEARTRMMESL